MLKWAGWMGASLGIIGALLLSMNIEISGWGYLFFLGSSLTLSLWSAIEKHYHQLSMQVTFTLINLNGCYHWLF